MDETTKLENESEQKAMETKNRIDEVEKGLNDGSQDAVDKVFKEIQKGDPLDNLK